MNSQFQQYKGVKRDVKNNKHQSYLRRSMTKTDNTISKTTTYCAQKISHPAYLLKGKSSARDLQMLLYQSMSVDTMHEAINGDILGGQHYRLGGNTSYPVSRVVRGYVFKARKPLPLASPPKEGLTLSDVDFLEIAFKLARRQMQGQYSLVFSVYLHVKQIEEKKEMLRVSAHS